MKNLEKGITLIALMATIIIMLILAAVTVAILIDGGIFDYASKSSRATLFDRDDDKIQAMYTSTLLKQQQNESVMFIDDIRREFGSETVVERNEDGTYTITLENGDIHYVGNLIEYELVTVESSDNYGIKVYAYDYSLAGDISVDIYFEIPEEEFSSKDMIRITNERRTGSNRIIEVEVNKDNFRYKKIGNKELYILRYRLVPKEMTDEIELCVYNGSTPASDNYEFSMRGIGLELIRCNQNSIKIIRYIKSLLNYGGYAQVFFDYYSDGLLANDGESIKTDESYVLGYAEEVSKNPITSITDFNTDYIKSISTSVSALNIAKIRYTIMLNNTDENYTYYINGVQEKQHVIRTDVLYIAKEIPFENYDDKYELKIYNSNNEEIAVATWSIMNEARSIHSSDVSSRERRLMNGAHILAQRAYSNLIK